MAVTFIDPEPSKSNIEYLDEPTKMGGSPPLGFVKNQIEKLSPTSKIRTFLENVASSSAEKMGAAGVNPKLSAALTTPVAILPDIVSAVGGISALEGDAPLARALTNTPKMLGREYQALDKAAGISGELPVQRGFEARISPLIKGNPPPVAELPYKPASYPRDFSSFINFAKSRIQGVGGKLSPQELDDYKTILSSKLTDMNAKGLSGTKPFAVASGLQKQVTQLHNEAIPGRSSLNDVYRLSKNIREIPGRVFSGTKKAAKIGAYGAGGVGGLGLLYKYLSGQ